MLSRPPWPVSRCGTSVTAVWPHRSPGLCCSSSTSLSPRSLAMAGRRCSTISKAKPEVWQIGTGWSADLYRPFRVWSCHQKWVSVCSLSSYCRENVVFWLALTKPAFAGMIFNEADQELRDTGYHRHAFNVLISTRLGYHRQLPDTRDAL